jgi:hypothetical protein
MKLKSSKHLNDMKPIFYLVTVLLEVSDECITDEHYLYSSYADAERAFDYEVAECQANFEGQLGESLIDLQGCREWRNADGYGFTVTIEEIQPK